MLGATAFPRMKHPARELVRTLQVNAASLFQGQWMGGIGHQDGRPIARTGRPNLDLQARGGRLVGQSGVKFAGVRRVAESEESSPRTHCITVSLAVDEHPHQPPKGIAGSGNGKIQASSHEIGRPINDAVIL